MGREVGCLDFDDPPFVGRLGGGEGRVESEWLSSEEGDPSSESEERTTWAFRLRPGRDMKEGRRGGEGRLTLEAIGEEQTRLALFEQPESPQFYFFLLDFQGQDVSLKISFSSLKKLNRE